MVVIVTVISTAAIVMEIIFSFKSIGILRKYSHTSNFKSITGTLNTLEIAEVSGELNNDYLPYQYPKVEYSYKIGEKTYNGDKNGM